MRRPKILLTRRWPTSVEQHLARRYAVTISSEDRPLTHDEILAAMTGHDALCPTVSDRIDARIVETAGATVRVIGNFGAGHEHIDLEAAGRAGIVVTNTPDVLTNATAELAILLMLMTCRRAGEGERELRSGKWTGWRPTHLLGSSLRGGLLGLVGFGRIAQATARQAHAAFGMRIAYHSRSPANCPHDLSHAEYHGDLDGLLRVADVVSLHCPGGAATHHLIDRRRLALMRPRSVLINTARGSLVDEQALAAALREGLLAAAGLDVYEREPAVCEELLRLDNVVLLPHLGSATLETRIAMGMRVAANLDSFFDGAEPADRVA